MNEDYPLYRRWHQPPPESDSEPEPVAYDQYHEEIEALKQRVEALEKASASPNLKKSGDFLYASFSPKGSREQSAEEFTNSGKLASADANDVEVSQLQNFGRRRKAQK